MPEVTVLTAVRNGEKFLSETIESILSQTFEDWEYIIVDDHSNDRTIKIIEKYIENDIRIKLIRLNENVGPYAAANIGLNNSKGKYIIRTDADDVSAPTRIQKQINFLKENNRFKACSTYAQRIDENSKLLPIKIKSTPNSGSIKWHLFLRCPLVHSTACVEKKIFEDMGGYNTSFTSQDYRMWCYLSRQNILYQLPEVLLYFRINNTGISAKHSDKQIKFGLEATRDHIFQVTGETFDDQSILNLYNFGLVKKKSNISQVIKISRKWDRLWMDDDSISKIEKEDLYFLSTQLRKSFLRRNRISSPYDYIKNLFSYIYPQPKKK